MENENTPQNPNTPPTESAPVNNPVVADPGHIAYIQKRRQENISDEMIRQELMQSASPEQITASYLTINKVDASGYVMPKVEAGASDRAYFVKKVSRQVGVISFIFKLLGVLNVGNAIILVAISIGNLYSAVFSFMIGAFYIWIANKLLERNRKAFWTAIILSGINLISLPFVVLSYVLAYREHGTEMFTVVVIILAIVRAISYSLAIYTILSLLFARKEFDPKFWESTGNTLIQ